jgi:hypothetical protein
MAIIAIVSRKGKDYVGNGKSKPAREVHVLRSTSNCHTHPVFAVCELEIEQRKHAARSVVRLFVVAFVSAGRLNAVVIPIGGHDRGVVALKYVELHIIGVRLSTQEGRQRNVVCSSRVTNLCLSGTLTLPFEDAA